MLARPDSSSVPVPPTATGEAKILDPLAGEATLRLGGVLSSFTVTDAVAEFPALSIAVPTTISSAVSDTMVTGEVQEAFPLVLSEQVKLTVGSELFHPAAFGVGVTAPAMLGGVLSSFTVTDVVAVFPALSVVLPTTTCPAVSEVIVTGAGQEAVPLGSSEQEKVTVESELFHCAAFGSGVTVDEMTGGVLSSFIVTEVVAMFPALSTAVPSTTWPEVSVEMVTGPGQEAMPLSASEQVKLTVGLELFHPAAFGVGVTVAVMVGGTVSVTMVASNFEGRLLASKYRRRPTALLWPPHNAPEVVPIRVNIFNERTSFVPSNGVAETVANETVTSFALFAFLVTPVTHKVTPDDTRTPFLYTSARTSKFVP